MHSSRMRTSRLLTVSWHALCRGVSAQGGVFPGVSVQGWGVCPGGVSSQRRGVRQGGCLPNGDVADTPPHQGQRQTPPL